MGSGAGGADVVSCEATGDAVAINSAMGRQGLIMTPMYPRAEQQVPSVDDCDCRIPGDLPKMAVRILKVPRVPAPESRVRGIGDHCAGLGGGAHEGVDFLFRPYQMTQRELRGAGRCRSDAGVFGERRTRIERERRTPFHLDEHDRAILELGADDPLGVEPEAVAIKPERAVQIGDCDGDDIEAGLHALLPRSHETESPDEENQGGRATCDHGIYASERPTCRLGVFRQRNRKSPGSWAPRGGARPGTSPRAE